MLQLDWTGNDNINQYYMYYVYNRKVHKIKTIPRKFKCYLKSICILVFLLI